MTLIGAVATILVLSIVVFIHELGHFLVARWCGVKISAFSIGFGPEIFAFNDRHGTRWRLAWIPLGGYVSFMDDENVASAATSRERLEALPEDVRQGAFLLKPLWQRAAVVAAGPLANFLFAIVVFAGMFMAFGIRTTAPVVDEVMPGLPAEVAGIRKGDVITRIDGSAITSFGDIQRIVGLTLGKPLEVIVERDGAPLTLTMTPTIQEVDDGLGGKLKRGVIGVRRAATPQTVAVDHPGPVEALWLGVKETGFVITSTLGFIRDVFAGQQNSEQIGGVVRIAEATKQVVDRGPELLPHFIALISVSIGLINLFPIPLLDGGHLMFYAIEAVRRRPLSDRAQEIAFRMGLAVVLMLMIFAFWNDRFIAWRWVGGNV